MLPDLTALMTSISLVNRVPAWNSIVRPLSACLLTASAISVNATADDSGGATMWAITSFFGAAAANAGARPSARIPASPLAAPLNTRRRLGAAEVIGLGFNGHPPDVFDGFAPTIAAAPWRTMAVPLWIAED